MIYYKILNIYNMLERYLNNGTATLFVNITFSFSHKVFFLLLLKLPPFNCSTILHKSHFFFPLIGYCLAPPALCFLHNFTNSLI